MRQLIENQKVSPRSKAGRVITYEAQIKAEVALYGPNHQRVVSLRLKLYELLETIK